MGRILLTLGLTAALTQASVGAAPLQLAAEQLHYTSDHHTLLPPHYRDWVFLTSSLDLNYNRAASGASATQSMFDNVFVNPSAYAAFVRSGQWPDGTVLVLENRRASSAGTISRAGKFQTEVASLELHIKDAKRFPGSWAFFITDGLKPARYVDPGADCYSCHARHGAVDSTFVQFYPTLLPIASAKDTLERGYLRERANP